MFNGTHQQVQNYDKPYGIAVYCCRHCFQSELIIDLRRINSCTSIKYFHCVVSSPSDLFDFISGKFSLALDVCFPPYIRVAVVFSRYCAPDALLLLMYFSCSIRSGNKSGQTKYYHQNSKDKVIFYDKV